MGSERKSIRAGLPADSVRTLAIVSRILERSLTEMTLPQFRVLGLISRAPERANQLARQAAISRPSLTGVLDGLEARGWVCRREVDGDRRGVSLEVTAAGRAALDVAHDAVQDRLAELLEHVAAERRDAALEGLAALGEAVQIDLELRRAAREGSA
ncbi:MAG: MarR family winged helix-turn-helix transcriptional regulator [Acidimicrobiia bacterium]